MNYAEQLTYWYLRLNGFIPLTNFVLHYHADLDTYRHTSDADLIAVRFPHVSELIGGQPDDWDPRFKDWYLQLTDDTIGLIVEVKSGGWSKSKVEARHRHMEKAIKRLGMFA